MDVKQLERLGFTIAAKDLGEKQELKRKIAVAYEKFRYVRQEKIDAYNEKLKKETLKETGKKGVDLVHHYAQLKFTPVSDYRTIPPQEVLDKIEEVQKVGCFDTFEVCKIEGIHEYKDPIIFGRIRDCPDRFFITQWLDDIRIEDILAENEG
jgi:hypothetical protein